MKYCRNCGKEIDENAVYCSHCGVNQYEKVKKDGFFKRVKKEINQYVVEDAKDENSLIKFMSSALSIGFGLLALYACLCGVYDILGFFMYLFNGPFIDFIVSIPCILAACLVVIVSLRAIKEIKKLGKEALENDKSKDILIKLFSGGIVAIVLIFLVFLS